MLTRRQFLATLASLPVAAHARPASSRVAEASTRVRGVNYIPSYAGSPYEAWSRYDGEAVRRELGWAAALGVNAVRVTLSCEACRERPTPFLEAMLDFESVAAQNGLRLMPVLFDSWGVAPSSYLGSATETLAETYRRIAAHPAAYDLDEPALKRYEFLATGLLPDRAIPRSGDASVMLWGRWTPCPEPDRIGQEYWALFRNYVHRAVGAWGPLPSILGWDVMNNPTLGRSLRPRPDPEAAYRFVALALDEVRTAGAIQPLTLSFSAGYGSIGPVVRQLDALSTQALTGTSRDVQRALLETKSLSKNQPVYLTFGGGVLLPGSRSEVGEDHQSMLVRQTIDAAESEDAGWFIWHLIEGESLSPWAGLLRRDGTQKPAAELLRREIRQLG